MSLYRGRYDPQRSHDQAIGFYRFLWRKSVAAFLAIEPRLSLGVVYMGGFYLQPSLLEADAVNFAHVKAPVLMLNGRFDR